jgi:hypothetical protein
MRNRTEDAMTVTKEEKALHAREVLGDLRRLIEALDARVPQLERIGEAQIAHEAADLRERALAMIRRIETDLPLA